VIPQVENLPEAIIERITLARTNGKVGLTLAYIKPESEKLFGFKRRNGGAERDRTVGLLNAIQALSQLSYSPLTT
jgi:hypothetical protein